MANGLILQKFSKRTPPKDDDQRYEQFFIRRNNRTEDYVCAVPPKNSYSPVEKNPEAQELDLNDASLLANAIQKIHESFSSSDCVWAYDLRGFYWTYGYCHGDKIIQYHETLIPKDRHKLHVPGFPNMVYVLGRFSRASNDEIKFRNQASPQQLAKYTDHSERMFRLVDEKVSPFSHQSQKVVVQMATEGSLCDMTWQPRSIEVVYKCDSSGGDRPTIIDVEEIKTCHYRMFIHVPALCDQNEFVGHKYVQDLVDVTCQRINDDIEESGEKSFDELSEAPLLRNDSPFPVRADNRINVAEHELIALSRGFYLARNTVGYKSSSEYYNNRNVILFNGFHLSLEDLNMQLGRTMFSSIGKNLLAPAYFNREQIMLEWYHSFIMWFEVYNVKGELLGLCRLLRNGMEQKNILSVLMFDPETLLDADGDMVTSSFDRPHYEAPYNMWNFEFFTASGSSPRLSRDKNSPNKNVNSEQPPVKESKPLDDSLVEVVYVFRVYNDGLLEDGTPNISVYDFLIDDLLKGSFNENGEYVFEYEPNPGQVLNIIAPYVEENDYHEFEMTFLEAATMSDSGEEPEETTVTVTKIVGGEKTAESQIGEDASQEKLSVQSSSNPESSGTGDLGGHEGQLKEKVSVLDADILENVYAEKDSEIFEDSFESQLVNHDEL